VSDHTILKNTTVAFFFSLPDFHTRAIPCMTLPVPNDKTKEETQNFVVLFLPFAFVARARLVGVAV